MKIEIKCNRGCITDRIEVNGTNSADMSADQLAETIMLLLQAGYYPDFAAQQSFIEEIAELNGEIRSLYYCEECGDHATETTLKADV